MVLFVSLSQVKLEARIECIALVFMQQRNSTVTLLHLLISMNDTEV